MSSFQLPKLSYDYDELEPYIDSNTLSIHHGKHHATYVNNLNAALENYSELHNKSLEELLCNLKLYQRKLLQLSEITVVDIIVIVFLGSNEPTGWRRV